MQRAERRLAEREGCAVRTLAESDYLLGVADETRPGALRFRWVGEEVFQAAIRAGVPALIELGRLLQITEHILRDEETDEDLQLIFAPGSSLGDACPKASVIDQHGRLSNAKFPKETNDYSMESREEIALRLAGQAGIVTPRHELIDVAGKAVMLSRRFDREGAIRTPFLSTMATMGGERGSSPEIVDAFAKHGAQGKADAHVLDRRVVFNVLISNVDDHLQSRFPVAEKGGLVSLAGIRPQSRSDRSEGSGADGEHRSRGGHLLTRSAGGRVGVLRAHAAAGPRDYQRGRDRDRNLARYRQGDRRPLSRDQPHRQHLHADFKRALAL